MINLRNTDFNCVRDDRIGHHLSFLFQEVSILAMSLIISIAKSLEIVADDAARRRLLEALSADRLERPVRVAFVNAHAVNLCHANPGFHADISAAEHVFRDGSGVKILLRLLGMPQGLNMNGTDFIPELLRRYAGEPVALFGTTSPYLERAAETLRQDGTNIVALADGFQDAQFYIEHIRRQRPRLVVLAMGMPKQERVAAEIVAAIDFPCLVVCGGAILDFIGGKVQRAPAVLRRFGMEWVYRLALEPRRLFKRYVIGNVSFFWRAVMAARVVRAGR